MVRAYAWAVCNFFYHRYFSQPSVREVVYQCHASFLWNCLLGAGGRKKLFFYETKNIFVFSDCLRSGNGYDEWLQ